MRWVCDIHIYISPYISPYANTHLISPYIWGYIYICGISMWRYVAVRWSGICEVGCMYVGKRGVGI